MWQQILNHLASLEWVIPRGRIRICPIQWQLRTHWSTSADDPAVPAPSMEECHLCIRWWYCRDGSVVFVPTSHTDGHELEPSTQSQPARLGEKVDATGLWEALMSSPWKIPCTRFAIRLTFYQMVVTGGEVELRSPTLSAPSISFSVRQCITDWLGSASEGFDHSKDMDIPGEGT